MNNTQVSFFSFFSNETDVYVSASPTYTTYNILYSFDRPRLGCDASPHLGVIFKINLLNADKTLSRQRRKLKNEQGSHVVLLIFD